MAVNNKSFVDGVLLGNSASILYTSSTYATITALSLVNTDTTTRTVNVWLVRSGDVGTSDSRLISRKDHAIAAKDSIILSTALNQTLEPGDTLYASADVANKVTMHAAGMERT